MKYYKITLFIFLLSFLVLSANYLKENKSTFEIEIIRYNDSSLKVKVKSDTYRGNLSIGNDFSNSNKYLTIRNKKYSQKELFFDGEIEYFVNLPIYWDQSNPYADINQNHGVLETIFLIMKSNEINQTYHLKFKNFTDVMVSDSLSKISDKEVIYDLDELYGSYIIFGDVIKSDIVLNNITFNLISHHENNQVKETINQSKKVIEYYHDLLGKPIINSTYTILFTNSTSFSTRDSGFFSKRLDIRFISHELFHLWQKDTNYCDNELLYKEGLAAFLEYYSLLENNYINKSEFENEFKRRKSLLTEINRSFYYMDSNLKEFRKNNPHHYAYLIYYKGSLIWKQIEQDYDIYGLFNNLTISNNCSKIDRLINENEKELYEIIY
ncbi:MAG: hypothetical protein ACOCP8_10365 [archaeon]